MNLSTITSATTGWFDVSTASTNIQLYPQAPYYVQSGPVYQPVAYQPVAPEPVKESKPDPLAWLRERVGEYVAAGVLA